ncbi:fatty acid desaturase family protein [Microcella flavibacter]|uniref:fatty acid desaturase family protein n=1 Tax=Microcella flavibacter TaxID=1804990 RepID=UPI00145750D1
MTSIASSSSGGFRSTTPRDPNRAHPTSTYSSLMRTVRDAGLLRRRVGFYVAVFSALVVALGGAVTGFILLGDSWYQLLIAAALGIILTQIAFVTHEASHRQIFASGKVNDHVGRWLAAGVVGISYHWWMHKHSRHHAKPNQLGADPDIAPDTISFVPEDAAKATGLVALITRKQGYLFFPLLTLEGLNLHFRSILSLFEKGKIEGRALELTLIFLRLGLYAAVVFWALPVGMAFAFIGVQMAVFGVYMGASFAPNHKGMPVLPHDSPLDFLTRQIITSRNIKGGWWATALYGGLNHQVEHHLFPNMPRPALAKAREITREYAATLDIPYTEANVGESYKIVVRYLNEVGLSARDPFDCPMVNRFRRT